MVKAEDTQSNKGKITATLYLKLKVIMLLQWEENISAVQLL